MSVRRTFPPPPPRRVSGFANGHAAAKQVQAQDDGEVQIDWANLSKEDKDVLFSWLDEFFAAYFKRMATIGSAPNGHAQEQPAPVPAPAKPAPPPRKLNGNGNAQPAPLNGRPPIPVRKSTTEAAPTTKGSFVTPVPPLPVRRPDLSLQHHAESEPAPATDASPPKPPPRRTLPPPFKGSSRLEPEPVSAAPRINLSTKPTATVAAATYTSEPEHQDVAECIRCRDYTTVDAHCASFPRQTVSSMDQLAWDLTSPFPHELDKLRAITFWLHLNIAYDAYSFLNNCVQPSTPSSTLESGLAVCEGYAGLFAALALGAGFECLVVSGHGKGFGYAPLAPGQAPPGYSAGHAWNAVRLASGDWKLVDSCWAGGALDPSGVFIRRWDAEHFVADNEEFGARHFPDPGEPWKQFVEPGRERTWEEYISARDEGPTVTGPFGEDEYARGLLWPKTGVIGAGRVDTVYVKKKCGHFREGEGDEYVHVVMGPLDAQERSPGRAGWKAMSLDEVNGGWRFDGLRVVKGEELMVAVVTSVGGRDAKGMGRREYERVMGKQEMGFSVLCQWKVE